MLFKATIALAILLANTCNRQGIEKETLLVREAKAPCTGVAPMQCLQVKHEQDTSWTLLYNNIEGFNYEEGYRYKIRVKVSTVKNPPADGSSVHYQLDKILEKTAVTASGGDSAAPWDFIKQKRWGLIQMEGNTLAQSPIWLEFDSTEQRFTGNGGCNMLSGGYTTEGNRLAFQQVISTRRACLDEQANERESALLRLLNDRSYTFDVADQTLNLYDSGKVVLMFGMQDKPAKEQQ